jgi:diguanylate cyclase (GGDEF)-like protein
MDSPSRFTLPWRAHIARALRRAARDRVVDALDASSPPKVLVQIERRLLALQIEQIRTCARVTIAVTFMTLLVARYVANGGLLAAIVMAHIGLLGYNLHFANKFGAELAAHKPKAATFRKIVFGSAASAFIWAATTWPLQVGEQIDFITFLALIIALFSICQAIIAASYHPKILFAVAVGGALGLAPKIGLLSPGIGPLLPLGFAIFMTTIVAHARTLSRQARGGVLLHMRNLSMSARLALANAALEATLARAQRLADRDALTDLRNRRAFERELESFMTRFSHRRCVLMLLDIDHFKSINDRFGHSTGDGTLLAIATCLKQWEQQGSGRMIGRWGGEEFIAVVALHPDESAQQHAETLRMRIAALGEVLHWPGDFSLSASIGCAMLTTSDALPDTLRDADAALYRAKDSGRNCCKIAA